MLRPHSAAILALSLLVFALSLGAAFLGAGGDSLYADPGRPDAASLKAVAGR